MTSLKCLLASTFLITLVGCSGKIVNQAVAPDECLTGVCEGVLYYRQDVVTVTYIQDKILNKDNVITHHAGAQKPAEACLPVQIEEQVIISAEKPSRILYKPGFLETSKFSVSLNANGYLASIGAESTPGAKMATDVLASVASSASILKDKNIMDSSDPNIFSSGVPLCNSGKIPVSITRIKPPTPPAAPTPDPCKGKYIGNCI